MSKTIERKALSVKKSGPQFLAELLNAHSGDTEVVSQIIGCSRRTIVRYRDDTLELECKYIPKRREITASTVKE